MLRIGICDDSRSAIAECRRHLEQFLRTKISHYMIREYEDPTELLQSLQEGREELDVLFLDVCMEGKNGIEVAREINSMQKNMQIVFLSNYVEYCTDVYDVEHFYFVLKVHLEQYLEKIIERVLKEKQSSAKKYIALNHPGKKVVIPVQEIWYLERSKRVTFIHRGQITEKDGRNLKNLLEEIQTPCFIRCHNSYAVNLRYVKEFGRSEFVLRDDTKIPISRRYLSQVRMDFAMWIGGKWDEP